MIILVTGDRNWSDKETIRKELIKYDCEGMSLIHGNCRGVDILAGEVAEELGWWVISVSAEWGKHGKAAGPIRNKEMLDLGPELVLAFHHNISESKGTKNCVQQAKKAGIPAVIITGGD